MAMKLATAYVDITAKDAGFKREMSGMRKEVENNVGQLASTLGGLGIGAALGAAVGGMLKIASAAESSETAFNVILKDMEKTKTLLQQLNKFSVVTPFEPAEVRKAGQSLLAFRTEADQIAPTLQFLGDAAAGTGAELQDMVRIFNKVKSVGKLTGETFEQFAERGVNLQAELTKSLGITGEEFIKLRGKGKISFDQVRDAMKAMTGEGGMFFEAMKKQSTTAAGLLSTLKGNVTALAGAFGKAMLPAFKAVLTVGVNTVNAIMALNTATGGLVVNVGLATGAVTALTAALIAARAAAKMLGLSVKGVLIGTGIGAILVGIGLAIGLVIKLVQAIAGSDAVMNAWKANVEKLSLAWNRIKTAALNAWEAIKGAVLGAIEAIAAAFGINFGAMGEASESFFGGMIEAVSNWVLNAAQWIQVFSENWGTTWDLIKNAALLAILFIVDTYTINFSTKLGYVLGRGLRLFMDFFSAVAEIAWKTLTSVGEMLAKVFTSVWQGIKNIFAGKDFGDVMRGAMEVISVEAGKFNEAFEVGWNKGDVNPLLKQSDAYKAAIAEQQRLLEKLSGRKRQLEREDEAALAPKDATGELKKEIAKKTEDKIVAEVKLDTGFMGLDQLNKSMQDSTLKAETAGDTMVKQGDAAAIAREEQTVLLKSIDEKSEATAPVAT